MGQSQPTAEQEELWEISHKTGPSDLRKGRRRITEFGDVNVTKTRKRLIQYTKKFGYYCRPGTLPFL